VLHERERCDPQAADDGQREGGGEKDPEPESDREADEEEPDPGEGEDSPAQLLATDGALEFLAPGQWDPNRRRPIGVLLRTASVRRRYEGSCIAPGRNHRRRAHFFRFLTGARPYSRVLPIRYTRIPSETIGEYRPSKNRHTMRPVLALRAKVPRGPRFT